MAQSQEVDRPARRWVSHDVLPALLAAVVCAVLMAISVGGIGSLKLDVGGRDDRFVSGFHEPEHNEELTFRWTMGEAAIDLFRPSPKTPSVLTLQLATGRPPDQPVELALSANQHAVGSFAVVSDLRRYSLLVPPDYSLAPSLAVHLDLNSDTVQPPGDARPLGLAVAQATLEPLGGWAAPHPRLLALAALLGVVGYASLRLMGWRRGAAWAGAVALAALMVAGVVVRPLEFLPFFGHVVFLVGLVGVMLLVARGLAPLQAGGPAGPRIAGADLPIFMALAWWAMLVFQIFLLHTGTANVGPRPPTDGIGYGLGLGLVGLGGWYALHGRRLPAGRALLRGGAVALLAGAALLNTGSALIEGLHRPADDFGILYRGVQSWLAGGSLYDLAAVTANHFGHVFKVPPFYGMLMLPFVSLDISQALLLHRLINVALIAITVAVWLRMWGLHWTTAGAGLLVLLNFAPLTSTVEMGQIDIVLLLLLSLTLWTLQRDRNLLAGVLTALATLFKIYPVLLLGLFVCQRRWRALAGFTLGMLLCNAVAILVMGWEMHRVYLFEVIPRIGGTTAWIENQTISGFLARLPGVPRGSFGFDEPGLVRLGLGISVALILFGVGLTLRRLPSDSSAFALQYSVFPLLMTLAVPTAWIHYQALLLIPFAALLLHLRDRQVGPGMAAALAISFALIGYGNQWSFYNNTVTSLLTVVGISYKFYGMLLLVGMLVSLILREQWMPALQRQNQPAPRLAVEPV